MKTHANHRSRYKRCAKMNKLFSLVQILEALSGEKCVDQTRLIEKYLIM